MPPVALFYCSEGLERIEEGFRTCSVHADKIIVAGDAMSWYLQANGWRWCCGCRPWLGWPLAWVLEGHPWCDLTLFCRCQLRA